MIKNILLSTCYLSFSFCALAIGLTNQKAYSAASPTSLLVGLFENTGGTWMKNSEVAWNARYRYLTKNWVNNWGFGAYDGGFALSYMKECDGLKTVPAISYYQMNDEPGGGEGQFLIKVQTPATMKSYFGDFKILMQRAKEFGKPVYILLEPDGVGFLQNQTGSKSETYAAIAASGMPELAGLPNTVAGFGLAFLAIKNAVGASNALLGLHISGWASGQDLFAYSVTIPLQPEIDKVYNFLAPLGLNSNVTGLTYDLLVGDPLDRDADYYKVVKNDGGNHWWDTSATASVNSRSFNRYREWLHLWNIKSGKPWVLWQIPLGNSNHLNVNNNGNAREGYKDNRPEYFLGDNGIQHCQQFASAGVIALLFGAGAGGVSSYGNDIYTDGKSFMQTRGAAFFAAGGVTLKVNSLYKPNYGHKSIKNRLATATSESIPFALYDVQGVRVKALKVNGDSNIGIILKDQMKSASSGQYFLKYTNSNEEVTKSIFLKH